MDAMTGKEILLEMRRITGYKGVLNIEGAFRMSKEAIGIIKRQQEEIERLKCMVGQNEGVLPQYEALIKSEAIREFAEKIDQLLNRYSHLHKYADKARKSTEEYDDGTPIEMVSVWEVLSLEKWEMVGCETMSELQGNIETIAKERLLSELEKDFRLLVKEMTEEQP